MLAVALLHPAHAISPVAAAALCLAVILSGFISKLAYDGLKTIIPPFDRLPATVHQIGAPFFGLLFGFVTSAVGAELWTGVSGVYAGWVGAVLTLLVQAGFKRLEKAQHPLDTTVTLEATRAAKSIR